MTDRVPPPDPPYEGPAAHTSDGDNLPATRVVLHSTVSPCVPGGRHAVAAYFRTEASGGSAHYVCDPVGVCQVVPDHVVAWHAPPNGHSFGVEMCDQPTRLTRLRWRDANHRAMLHVTAQLVAQLCACYGIPPRFLSVRQLRRGGHGVTTHNNVSRAWRQSTHWDPGAWPRRRFMRLVVRYHHELVMEARTRT